MKLCKRSEENFKERKELLIENLKKIAGRIFQKKRILCSVILPHRRDLQYWKSSATVCRFTSYGEKKESHGQCIIHCKKRNEGFRTSSKVQYVARTGNFIDGGAEYTGALQILKVIFKL